MYRKKSSVRITDFCIHITYRRAAFSSIIYRITSYKYKVLRIGPGSLFRSSPSPTTRITACEDSTSESPRGNWTPSTGTFYKVYTRKHIPGRRWIFFCSCLPFSVLYHHFSTSRDVLYYVYTECHGPSIIDTDTIVYGQIFPRFFSYDDGFHISARGGTFI